MSAPPVTASPQRMGIGRASVLSMLGLIALGLTRLVHGGMVSRATDNATFGRVGTLIAVTTIASLLLPAGVASATSRYVPFAHGRGDEPGARAVHRFLTRWGAGGALLFGAGAGLGAAAWLGLDWWWTVQVVALALTFSLYSVDKAALYGFGRVTGYARLELVSSAVAVAATVAVVLSGSTAYLLPLAAGYLVFVIGARLLLRPALRGPVAAPGTVERRPVLRYVLLACVGTLASQGFLQGTQLLATLFTAPAEVSYFAAAVTLVAPMYFLPRALGLALFPAMSHAHGAGDVVEVRRQADLSTRALFVLLAPVFAVGILLAREVVVLFGSQRYAGGTVVLQLMLAATFFAVVAVAAVNTLSSGDHVHIPVAAGVLGATTGLVMVYVFSRMIGATGIGLGYLIGAMITAGFPILMVWRRYSMSWSRPLVTAGSCVAAALAAGIAIEVFVGPHAGTAARTGIDAAAAVVALAACAILLRHQVITVLRGRLRRSGPSPGG